MPVTSKLFLRRPGLARDITIILAVKVLALLAIKLIWFSHPPNPPAEQVQRTVLGIAAPDPFTEDIGS